MKTFTEEELKKVIENHNHWLLEDCNGWEDMRANLVGANLVGANLRGAYLRGANLRGANLVGADFTGSDLRGAYLRDADLRDADLTEADLTGADLYRADFRGADLRGADLYRADLYRADFTGANLRGSDLRGTDLTEADLRGAKNVPYLPMACPDEGAFIGWKKAVIKRDYYIDTFVIVKLRIPADANRSSVPFRRKCRCSKAKVVGAYSIGGKKITDDAHVVSIYDHAFVYSVGSIVEVDNFCTDKFKECAPGIHFFMNRQEAIDYDA